MKRVYTPTVPALRELTVKVRLELSKVNMLVLGALPVSSSVI